MTFFFLKVISDDAPFEDANVLTCRDVSIGIAVYHSALVVTPSRLDKKRYTVFGTASLGGWVQVMEVP